MKIIRPTAILFLASLAFSQTSNYPGALDSIANLTDLADRAQTTLSASVNATATSFTVVSASKFTAGMILTIDNEQIKVWSVSGNTIHVGNSGIDNVDGRGFAGTSAASHNGPASGSLGALVSNYFVSYQFKALRNAIQALQSALGVGLANVASSTSLVASDYAFAAQDPPENLSPTLKTFTLAKVPRGVNGNDSGHSLGIYNNSGTWQENCLINGGSATAGAASGTLICTSLSGTYATGAYKIGSATGGAAEAQQVIASSGSKVGIVQFTQTATFHATVEGIANTQISWRGGGDVVDYVVRATDFTNGHLFSNSATNAIWYFDDLGIEQGTFSQAGAAIRSINRSIFIRNTQIYGGQYGLYLNGVPFAEIDGFGYAQNQNTWQPVAGIYITSTTGHESSNIFISGSSVQSVSYDAAVSVNTGLWVAGVDGLHVSNSIFAGVFGVKIDSSIAGTYNANQRFTGLMIDGPVISAVQFAGSAMYCSTIDFTATEMHGEYGTAASGTGPGVDYGQTSPTSCNNVTFNGGTVTGFVQSGFNITTPAGARHIAIRNMRIINNGLAGAGYSGIYTQASITGLDITGNTIGNDAGTAFGQDYAVYAIGTLNANISGNTMAGNAVGPVFFNGAMTGLVASNKGLNDGVLFASIPANLPNGTTLYVTDSNAGCTAGSSTGQICTKVNGAWAH